MRGTIGQILLYSSFFFLSLKGRAQMPVMDDPEMQNLIKRTSDSIYNQNFEASENYLRELKEKLPEHPICPLMQAMVYFWKGMPLDPHDVSFKRYFKSLKEAAKRSDKLLEMDPESPEAIFLALSTHGLLAQHYAEEKSYLQAVREAKKCYEYIKIGFGLTHQYPEFYFSSGMYNYYRVQYPESNPVYRPLMWVFAPGDKELGLEQLQQAIEKALYVRTEAITYLAHINLRYLHNPGEAIYLLSILVGDYPKNPLFQTIYVEALLEDSQYELAKAYIDELLMHENIYVRMSAEVFKGILLEKAENKSDQAAYYYSHALETSKSVYKKRWNYKSFAHAGLARIAAQKGDKKLAKKHYQEALNNTKYDSVREEAEAFLGK
ncbi:hypothetical protein [Xanthovirga aplysinae]|uniref:hypothetical protein n=1 Tax=Xanthovirga aplysinae TaxID=2529853 RepID=UPI0012BCDB10|nr:hypothetical protein [Xanthovirga aplysinae]MTI33462.1 hypothetical protein [Xanthovirga aplysinae]